MQGLLPNVDPDGLLEFSVVYTDRSLNHMSEDFKHVMVDISSVLKDAYNASSAVIVPGSGTFGMEADIKGQMTSTGQVALQELSRRLEDSPEDFTVGQLHGTIDLLLVQPAKQGGGPGGGSAAPPTFNLQFVGSQTPALRDVIDVTPEGDA